MKRTAQVKWNGSGKTGSGLITTESSALRDVKYKSSMRFENETGTNPEELIAAAHASCFSMALAYDLEKSGFQVSSISTRATVNLQNLNQNGWAISDITLDVEAKANELNQEKFVQLAEQAKTNCPVSKALNVPIKLSAKVNPT